jgi:hypothetical protein
MPLLEGGMLFLTTNNWFLWVAHISHRLGYEGL